MIEVDDISRGVLRVDEHLTRAVEFQRQGDISNVLSTVNSYLGSPLWSELELSGLDFKGITLPHASWNLVISLLIQVGEFEKVGWLIGRQFATENVSLHFDANIDSSNIRIDYIRDNLLFYLHPLVSNSVLWFAVLRFVGILPMLVHVYKLRRGDGSIQIGMGDSNRGGEASFCSKEPGGVLVPDPLFIETGGYDGLRRAFSATAVDYRDKQTRAMWRGSTTGIRPTSRWRTLPRAILCEIGAQNAEFFDCGITHVVQCVSPEETNEVTHSDLIKSTVRSLDFDKYRFHIDIDGNTNSWPGLFIKLLSGGTVFKVASPEGYRQWYYDRLIAWHHYVPVESGMGDLIDKVKWASQNIQRAEHIGRNGRALAEHMSFVNEMELSISIIERALA